jgi:hypothetical protein
MPWGKDPHDPTSQIGVVRAVRAGDGSIAVAWDWRPFLDDDPVFNLDIDSRREIVELRLLHGTGSAPAFVPPVPFGEKLSDRLDPEGWYKIFDDLDEDREHFFSIYGKEKSGQWTGPWTVRGHVDWGSGTNLVPSLPASGDSWTINIVTSDASLLPAGPDIEDGVTAAVYSYDPAGLEDMGFIESATIAPPIAVTVTTAGTISFYPLRYAWDGTADGYDILMNSRFTKDETGAVHKSIAADGDISFTPDEARRLISRMALLGGWRILIEASNSGAFTVSNPPAFSFNYWWN